MKTMKKTLSVLLTVIMLVGFLTMTQFAGYNVLEIIPMANAKSDDFSAFNGHNYQLFDEGLEWQDAQQRCNELGGHLATITSEEEQNFIQELLKNAKKNCYWLGAQKVGNWANNTFEWVTGEEWSYNKGKFNNWTSNGEDSLMIYAYDNPWESAREYAYDWNDLFHDGTCGTQSFFGLSNFGYICEWESDIVLIEERSFDVGLDHYANNMNSSTYDAKLANMMAALSASVYDRDNIAQAYDSLGFKGYDYSFGVYDYDGFFDPLKCGYSLGFKKSDYNDDTICLISVRGTQKISYNYGSDWIGDFDIRTDSEEKHIGFSAPSLEIYLNILRTIVANQFTGEIKYFITGHSRGAAVANLLAVDLMEDGVDPSDIYCYTFACPDVACKQYFPTYNNIFNLCNHVDLVPKVPGELVNGITSPGYQWGKFGMTLWFTSIPDDTKNPFAGHSMKLYLEFFDQQLNPNEYLEPELEAIAEWRYNVLHSWGMGWLTKVLCPVDVKVTDMNGNTIATVVNGEVSYDKDYFGNIMVLTDGEKKVIYVSGDRNFNVELTGTGSGTMTFSVDNYNLIDNEVIESKSFTEVVLENGKLMYSPVSEAAETEEIELFVVRYDNGEFVATHTIDIDGTEMPINGSEESEIIHEPEYHSSNCACGGYHTGPFAWLIRFFHRIIYFFKNLFK